MNREQLQRLLAVNEEGQNVEFKSRIDTRSIGREVCAFLNSGGGYLVLGVSSDGGKVNGVPSHNDLQLLEQAIISGLSPQALVSFEQHTVEGKAVWVIEIPAGHDLPYGFRDEIFIRTGPLTRRADVATLRDMVLRRQDAPERWERRYSDADIEQDLDEQEIRAAAGKISSLHRAGLVSGETTGPVGFLQGLGLIKYGRLTNGGDILFARTPAIRHPQVRVRAVCYSRNNSDDHYRDLKNLEGPLVSVLEQAHAFIQRNTPSRSIFKTGELNREQQDLYPPEAIREGLINAFAHRDYADFRGGITIHIHPGRLDIWNSGTFPEGITAENLAQGHLSILRNPDIAHVLYSRGLMEKLGRGGPMIRNSCEAHGLPLPCWHADARGVTLSFFATEDTAEVTTEVTTEVTAEVKDVLRVLDGEMSRRQLQQALDLSSDEHFRKHYLVPALNGGFIEMTRPDTPTSRLQTYRVTAHGSRAKAAGEKP